MLPTPCLTVGMVLMAFMCFTEERLPSGNYLAIKPRSVECCSDGCPSGSSSRNSSAEPSGSWSPSPPLAQFGQAASSRKSHDCSKPLPFKNYGGHCALGNLQCSRIVSIAFPKSVSWHNSVFVLCRQFIRHHGLAFALIYIVSYETLYRQVCAFPNHVQLIGFTTDGNISMC